MKFIQKLIQNTKDGNLDFIWNYTDGSKKYTYKLMKDPLNGLNFSSDASDNLLIFPNGFGLECQRSDLDILINEINLAMERAVDSISNDYQVGEILQVQDTSNEDNIEPENENKEEEPIKRKSNKKNQIKA